jgi:hypothetical protein
MIADSRAFVRHEQIEFDWEQSKGFRSISVGRPHWGTLYSHLIAFQAKSHIASSFENAGWKSARGRLNVRVFCFLFVLGIDNSETWTVEIIDPEVTALMHAAEDGDAAMVKQLIAKGADVNARDQRGWTALMHASMKGRNTEARLLLAAGGDPNIKDQAGRTPFLWAAWNCRYDLGVALIVAGADVSIKDAYGTSALSYSHCKETVQKMLEKAEPTKQTAPGSIDLRTFSCARRCAASGIAWTAKAAIRPL